MKLLPNKKLILPLALIALLFLGQQSFAQITRSFTIVPPGIEMSVDPGGYREGTMKVINDSSETLSFTANIKDFIVNDENGTPNILPTGTLDNKYAASSWIGITPSQFTIAPHSKQDLNYYIQVPSDARPGGHYAAVVYKPNTAGSVQGTGATVSTQIGTLFYVGVNGNIKEGANILKFITNAFQEYGPVKLTTQIQNNGDLHVKPIGSVTLYNIFGQRVDTKGLPEHNIFPGGGVRNYENTVGSKIMIGPYTAKLLASYGVKNNLPLSAAVTFWVFPWKIALLLVLVIIAAILGYKYMNRKGKTGKDSQPETKEPSEAPHEPTTTS